MKISKIMQAPITKTKQLINSRNNPEKWVQISDYYTESGQKLYKVRELLANYAKAEKVKVQIYNDISDESLLINVKNKHGKSAHAMVDGDVNSITTVERNKKVMLEDKDGCNYEGCGTESHEDTFLRRVYRSIEGLVHTLKG